MLGQTAGSFLNQKIEVQTRTVTDDDLGGVEVWATDAIRWGRIMGIGIGMEIRTGRWAGQRSEATHELLFRGQHDFPIGEVRFKWQGKVFIPIEPGFDPGGFMGMFTNIRCRIALEER